MNKQVEAPRLQLIQQFLAMMEQKSLDGLMALFADDCQCVHPFRNDSLSEMALGFDATQQYWQQAFRLVDRMTLSLKNAEYIDNERIFLRFNGDVVLAGQQEVFHNDYYSTFIFNTDGKVREYVELFNPLEADKEFNLRNLLRRH